MSVHSSAYLWNGDTLVLHIFLQPRASQNEWAGRHNGRIRLRVTAVPVDNQANRECVKFISKSFYRKMFKTFDTLYMKLILQLLKFVFQDCFF